MNSKSIDELRNQFYDARAIAVRKVHDELMILRVRPDFGRLDYQPGQYTLLGLGAWEPRVDGVVAAHHSETTKQRPLIRRAYSISCPILDDAGRLARTSDIDFVEFYITLVLKPTDEPPPLSPRLFALNDNDRLYLGPHAAGRYTLEFVQPHHDVLLVATGTGKAPHNAMLAELLSRGHEGRVFCCTCARYRTDLAYLDVHRELERRYANYRYFALTTREPENVDPNHPQYIGKQYLQDFFASGRFEREAGLALDADRMHVYLCGNPAMIGLPTTAPDGRLVYPEPPGMIELLVRHGLQLDKPHVSGNIHFEKYW